MARMGRLLLTILLSCVWGAPLSALAYDMATAARHYATREAALQLKSAALPVVQQAAQHARIDVAVGALDGRLQNLAPCMQTEFFVPSGMRLWGRASIGLRCTAGASWSVLLPVNVRIFGPALVAARPLRAGSAIGAGDLITAEIEWTRDGQGVVTDVGQLEDRMLLRPLGTRQPIPLTALRSAPAVGQGDIVKLVGAGRGFAVTTQAVALVGAAAGEPVRVRTEFGRVLTGTARKGRVVEVAF